MAAHCILSEDSHGFIAMHLVYGLLYLFWLYGSNEASNLGGWERSSFGRLRGTHGCFCDCLGFRIRSVQPPGASSITIEYDCSSLISFPTGCCSGDSALRYLYKTTHISLNNAHNLRVDQFNSLGSFNQSKKV